MGFGNMYPPGSLRTYIVHENFTLEKDFFYDPDERVDDHKHPMPPHVKNQKHPTQQNHRKHTRK